MRRKEQEGNHTERWMLSVALNDCTWYQLLVSHDAVRTSRGIQQYKYFAFFALLFVHIVTEYEVQGSYRCVAEYSTVAGCDDMPFDG